MICYNISKAHDDVINSFSKTIESTQYGANSTNNEYQLKRTRRYYNIENQEFYRIETNASYKDHKSRQLTLWNQSEYSVDAEQSLILIKQTKSVFTNGFLTQKTIDQYLNEQLSNSIVLTYARDAQGRITDLIKKNESENPLLHVTYIFDDSGRLTRLRSYDYTSGIQNNTPICEENLDYEYAKDLAGNVSKTITSYCNGSSYQTVPFQIENLTFNSMGLLTSKKQYNFSGSSSYISFREDYQYDDEGFMNKIQYYEGSGSSMQTAAYTIRERDENLFTTSEKSYNSLGKSITSVDNTSSTCNTKSYCYSMVEYEYE